MNIRRPVSSDIGDIQDIAACYDSPLVSTFETAGVVTDNEGKVKAFGVVRTLLEAVLYCDGSKQEKAIALKKLMQLAIDDAKRMEQDQLYVFADNEFSKVLIKHFGFRRATEQPLILDL